MLDHDLEKEVDLLVPVHRSVLGKLKLNLLILFPHMLLYVFHNLVLVFFIHEVVYFIFSLQSILFIHIFLFLLIR